MKRRRWTVHLGPNDHPAFDDPWKNLPKGKPPWEWTARPYYYRAWMVAWVNRQLDYKTEDDIDKQNMEEFWEQQARAIETDDLGKANLEYAIEQAKKFGHVEPLRQRFPEIAEFIHRPKRMKKGDRFPKQPREGLDCVEEAAKDYSRIKSIWKEYYGRMQRTNEPTAIDIAARRWGVAVEEIQERLKRKSPTEM